jgi:hypothetical protein
MEDEFSNQTTSLTAPVTKSEVITPNDAQTLNHVTRGLYVGQGGDVTVRMLSGEVTTLANAQSGVLYPLRITQVLATGTTATNLLGMR